MASSRTRSVLLVLGCAIGCIGGLAVLFLGTFSLFIKPLTADLHWTRSQASLLVTMGFAGYGIGAPVLGNLYDRLGIRRVQVGGIVVFALGLAALGVLPGSLPLFAATSLLLGFCGGATAASGYALVLSKTFQARLGLAIGCTMAGFGAGAATMPIITQALISHLGWRHAYLCLAAIALVCGTAALLLGVGSRSRNRRQADGSVATATTLQGATPKEALQSWRFWLLASTAFLIGSAGFGAMTHLAAILSDRGLGAAAAAKAAGVLGLGILSGRFITAVLMDRIFAPFVAMVACMLGGSGLYLLAIAPVDRAVVALVAAYLTGFVIGGEGDIMPILTKRYFGDASFGAIFGMVTGAAAFGGIIGPLVFGWAFDTTGGYRQILIVGACVCVASGFSFLMFGADRASAVAPVARQLDLAGRS